MHHRNKILKTSPFWLAIGSVFKELYLQHICDAYHPDSFCQVLISCPLQKQPQAKWHHVWITIKFVSPIFRQSDTHPCEVSYVQGDSFSSVGVHHVGQGAFPSLCATWGWQWIQVIPVFWSITIIGWWGYYVIIQVDLLMNWVVSFLY